MELKQAFWILRHGSGEGLREYLKAVKTIEDSCVPVVRCRDCKYSYEDISGRCCSHGPCKDWVVLDDSSCGQGERRTGNGKAVDEG